MSHYILVNDDEIINDGTFSNVPLAIASVKDYMAGGNLQNCTVFEEIDLD